MTTFTTEDRILAEKNGSFTINVEGGTVTSPPHIVDSGASVMDNKPVAWMYESKNVDGKPYISDMSLKPLFGLVTRYGYKEIPLYTHPVKELTDEEIANTWNDVRKDATLKSSMKDIQDFARAILRKAQEK